ncbi:MAG TPA: hypothetical protein VLH94_04180 [Spirochaetia bacterium]|nr:hypothetical protein [Spirochaetia bacterium]
MKNTYTRRANYFLGTLGEIIISQMFPLTKKVNKRSFDLRVPIEKNEKVGHRLECKTRRLRSNNTFQVNFTRHERTHSDTVVILVLDGNFGTERLYFIPTYAMPREKGYLYFGKKPTKYENYRLI